MPLTPQITGPDGVDRDSLVFTTTRPARFFSGTALSDTIEVQVSIRGDDFTSDPDLVLFDGETFTIPNPSAYPDGLDLVAGSNEVLVRCVSTSGLVSYNAMIEAILVQDGDLGVLVEAPSNVHMVRLDGAVKISVDGLASTDVVGYNFYASKFSGGGETGYFLLNPEPITAYETTEDVVEIDTVDVDTAVELNLSGDPVADPLFFSLSGEQQDQNGSTINSDFTQSVAIPETTRNIRTSIVVSDVRAVNTYSFRHSRTAGIASDPSTIANGDFASTPDSDPLYYVVTAVYYDATVNQEVESPYSAEVVGSPIRISTVSGSLPTVSRQAQLQSLAYSILRSRPEVRVDAGSVLSDTVLDPATQELDRVRFIQDFIHRSQSFADLLAIDDQTEYKTALKQAFYLTSDSDAQSLIDQQFDQLANRVGRPRRAGRAARASVTFSTFRRPTASVSIPLGFRVSGGSTVYAVTKPVVVGLNDLASFYDPISGAYKVTTTVQATSVGSTGNVGPGQIRSVVDSLPTWTVVNSARAFGGLDTESNQDLAEAAQAHLASLDVGTEQGYSQTIAGIPGVTGHTIVGVGHALMQRDMDETGTHFGGKVDAWIRGDNTATVTDSFAFNYEVHQNVHFTVVGDPLNLEFEAQDPTLSQDNPIAEMLDYPADGLEFVNATTGLAFDLTDVTITSYNRIQLSSDVAQPSLGLEDVVFGSYRFRQGRDFELTRQPVSEIVSVVGSVSGELDSSLYELHHPDSPLDKGRSSIASDYLRILQGTDSNGNTIPSGTPITVTGETHVLLGEFAEPLDNLGASFLTIAVWDEGRTVQYLGPNDPSGNPDYTIVLGTDTTATAIQRTSTSTIPSGSTVSVDYTHEENFTVTYKTNLVVSTAQDELDLKRHGSADVLAKAVLQVPVDVAATIVLMKGQQQSIVDPQIRTNLANYFAKKTNQLTPSNFVRVVENTTGVSSVVLPLTTFIRQPGTQVVHEAVTTDQAGDVKYIPAWSTSRVSVWLIKDMLSSAVADSGGPDTLFKGISQDDLYLDLRSSVTSLTASAGGGLFVGVDGLSIPGYSDNATLDAQGFETDTEKTIERKRLTANRILVSTSVDESPNDYSYTATYAVGDGTGVTSITLLPIEELVVGNLDFTFDEEV